MALSIVPNAGQTLAVTRDPIRNNFGTIDAAFSVDHAAYGSANQGQHIKVTFPAGGVVVPGLNEMVLYSKLDAGTSYLYVRRNNGAVSPEIPWTRGGSNTGLNGGMGFTYLPSGMLIKWGTFALAGTAQRVISVNVDFPGSPNFTNLFTALITPIDSTQAFFISANGVNNAAKTLTIEKDGAGNRNCIVFVFGNVA